MRKRDKAYLIGPKVRKVLGRNKSSCFIPLEDLLDGPLDTRKMCEEIAKGIANAIDKSARERPTALYYEDGVARLGMYRCMDEPNEAAEYEAMAEMTAMIRLELMKAEMPQYASKVYSLVKDMPGQGRVCGSYVDLPGDEWLKYEQGRK